VLWDYGIFFHTFTQAESSTSVCASCGGDVCLQPSCKCLIHLNNSLQRTREAFWYKSVKKQQILYMILYMFLYLSQGQISKYSIKNVPKQYIIIRHAIFYAQHTTPPVILHISRWITNSSFSAASLHKKIQWTNLNLKVIARVCQQSCLSIHNPVSAPKSLDFLPNSISSWEIPIISHTDS